MSESEITEIFFYFDNFNGIRSETDQFLSRNQ